MSTVSAPSAAADDAVRDRHTVEHLDRALSRHELAATVARDIPPGSYVDLGIGQPTTVADYLLPESGIVLHTENGMLGLGPAAVGDEIDPDLINGGKTPVTELPGASYFHHADSFAMMRGGQPQQRAGFLLLAVAGARRQVDPRRDAQHDQLQDR